MNRRVWAYSLLALLALALLAVTVYPGGSLGRGSNTYRDYTRIEGDALSAGSKPEASSGFVDRRRPLGRDRAASAAPGVKVGDTWFDCQHRGRVPRMINWGYDVVNGLIVHFSFHDLPDPAFLNRRYAYNCWFGGGDGTLLGETTIQPLASYAGFVCLDVTSENRAVIGGHNNINAISQSHVYWQAGPGDPDFSLNSRVPNTVAAYGGTPGQQAIWPSMCYQDVAGQTPVTHLFSQIAAAGPDDPQAIYYFRKIGACETGPWDPEPYVVDTVFNIAQDVVCSNIDGMVALVWIANLPEPDDCDTCSSNTGLPQRHWDNDIYYQVSYDYGATFCPRQNLTMNVDGVDGFRPYSDVSSLIDNDGYLHIAWSGSVWPADANSGGESQLSRCHLFHWGNNLPGSGYDDNGATIRTVADLNWEQTTCAPGGWNLQASKMSISECDGKLYHLWVQFNDIPGGIEDDCAARCLYGGDCEGAANGELYLSVSDDGGYTWDPPRNLTNTRTPGCDPDGGIRCQSEHWPSMARFGTNHPASAVNNEIVDPSGSYIGDWFLDVQYIDDPDPGALTLGEGTWQLADVRWFRLACVEPVPNPQFCPSLQLIGYPAWTGHGEQFDTSLTIENPGNADLTFSVTVEQDTGPPGWLATVGFETGIVSSGETNTLQGTVMLNVGGVVNAPGTTVNLKGRLIFTSNAMTSPDTLAIDIYVDEDTDTDGIIDGFDNCVSVYNPGQEDGDLDGVGDSCDVCPGFDDNADGDTDGVPDSCDNCPAVANSDQADSDGNGIGDACDDCCVIRGDINDQDGGPDIADLVYLITYMFQFGPEPPCMEAANIDGEGGIGPDISDLVYLVTYMFQFGPEPVPCP